MFKCEPHQNSNDQPTVAQIKCHILQGTFFYTFCSMLSDAHLETISSRFMSSLVSKNGVLLNSFTVHFHA